MDTPNRNKLLNVKIIGFFSIPDPALAADNPEAYQMILKSIPFQYGAGQCSHCGMGIKHNVLIEDENGVRRCIGTMCAEKVGIPSEQIRNRITSEKSEKFQAERDAKLAKWNKTWIESKIKREAEIAFRTEYFSEIVSILKDSPNDFYNSLLSQLLERPLTWKQANYLIKVISPSGRINKKNEEMWMKFLNAFIAKSEQLGYKPDHETK
jgi:hypothetical protein